MNQYETQASIDAALTFAILWLDACRYQLDQRMVVEGLKLFLPAGTSGLTRERLATFTPARPSGICMNTTSATIP